MTLLARPETARVDATTLVLPGVDSARVAPGGSVHTGAMISVDLARRLRSAGLRWRPASGDRFVIEQGDLDGDEVYTLSDMTVEAHHYPTGTVLGFNGTTEWALDSVSIDEALWLPREDQLRALLGPSFVSLSRTASPRPEDGTEAVGTSETDGSYEVRTRASGTTAADRDETHVAATPDEAYGSALLAYIEASLRLD